LKIVYLRFLELCNTISVGYFFIGITGIDSVIILGIPDIKIISLLLKLLDFIYLIWWKSGLKNLFERNVNKKESRKTAILWYWWASFKVVM